MQILESLDQMSVTLLRTEKSPFYMSVPGDSDTDKSLWFFFKFIFIIIIFDAVKNLRLTDIGVSQDPVLEPFSLLKEVDIYFHK